MLSDPTKAAVRESWDLVRKDTRGLTKRFYSRLFEVAPGVRPLFPEEMGEQRQKLAQTLRTLATGLDDLSTLVIALTQLGERHSGYGAEPDHYPVVGETLIWAMKDQAGDAFTAEHEAAWVETYSVVAGVMIEAQQAVPA